MGLFDMFSGKNEESDVLNDASYVGSLRHIRGPWNQYDFKLAAQGYGWGYILSSADYMTKADLADVGTISVTAGPGGSDIEYIDEYRKAGGIISAVSGLSKEGSMLGLGGRSKACHNAPVKIVWINQTNVIRILSPLDDEDLFIRYMETVIRRSFGTADEMKKGNTEVSIINE